MSDLSPGQEVTVSPNATAATVVYVRYDTARVRFTSSGRERTVALCRVTPKRESKALSVGPLDPSIPTTFRVIDEAGPWPLIEAAILRPVPKPVTLTSPAYLAYVRKRPCCLCGRSEGVEAHHWSHHGSVMGAKVDDYRTAPLCQDHHRYCHDHGTLPDMDRAESEALFLWHQRSLVATWCIGKASDGDVVDALIRAIGGADA